MEGHGQGKSEELLGKTCPSAKLYAKKNLTWTDLVLNLGLRDQRSAVSGLKYGAEAFNRNINFNYI